MLDSSAESVREYADGARPNENSALAKLFDIRTMIGLLFVVYGVLIGGAGVMPGSEALRKAEGININLWTGLAMLVVGGLFLLWVALRPLEPAAESETS